MPRMSKGTRVSLEWKCGAVVGTVEREPDHGWVFVKLDEPVEDRDLVAVRESRVSAVLVG
jgi:hypothetical protein